MESSQKRHLLPTYGGVLELKGSSWGKNKEKEEDTGLKAAKYRKPKTPSSSSSLEGKNAALNHNGRGKVGKRMG